MNAVIRMSLRDRISSRLERPELVRERGSGMGQPDRVRSNLTNLYTSLTPRSSILTSP